MKKIILPIVVIIGVLSFMLVGCEEQKALPYIEKTTSDQSIIKAEETFSLKFFVINPTVNTFVGNITYQFEGKCLSVIESKSDNVEVRPNGKNAFVKEFEYMGREKRYYGGDVHYEVKEISDCIQTPLKISVSLYDKSGYIRDNQEFYVTITLE